MLELLLHVWRAALGPRPTKKKLPPRARRTPAQRRAIAVQAQAMLKMTAEQDAHWRRERALYEQDARRRAAGRQDARVRASQPVDLLGAYCDDTPRMQPQG